jgi:flagellar motor switch protein FliG
MARGKRTQKEDSKDLSEDSLKAITVPDWLPQLIKVRFSGGVVDYDNYSQIANNEMSQDATPHTGRTGALILGDQIIGHVKMIAENENFILEIMDPGIQLEENDLSMRCGLSVEIAARSISLDAALSLAVGSIVDFCQSACQSVDLLCENILIARGEVVVIDEYFGLRVTDMVLPPQRLRRNLPETGSPTVICSAVLGRAKPTIAEILSLGEGSIISLDRKEGEPISLEFENCTSFLAEVVVIDENLGVRILAEDGSHRVARSNTQNSDTMGTPQISHKVDPSPVHDNSAATLEWLQAQAPEKFLNFIQNEHPQTIALVLSILQPQKAAVILASMPVNMQADSIKRLAQMDRISEITVEILIRTLSQKITGLRTEEFLFHGGVRTAAAVLNRADRSTEATVLGALGETEPELAEYIKKNLFVFEDIVLPNKADLKRLLTEVDLSDLVFALRGSTVELENLIYDHLSEEKAAKLRDGVSLLSGAVPDVLIDNAKSRIISLVRKLEEQGDIVVSRA